jgi:DUF2075 family protein/DNA replication protein DnaC
MIVYQSTKLGFSKDVLNNEIEKKITEVFISNLKRQPIQNEILAWRNSMMYMENVLQGSNIPNDCGIMIEYQIPQMMKRIDFMITGRNKEDNPHLVIVELKQWTEAKETEMDGIVLTAVGGGIRETGHPSYQAWSYAQTIRDYNSAAESNKVEFSPCAYLHNMNDGTALKSEFYSEYLAKAPIFIRSEVNDLRNFVSSFIQKGDKGTIMKTIEEGDIRPSKHLAQNLKKMVNGSKEFIMLDEQKIVYEKVLNFVQKKDTNKKILICEGGPGTGKSVVAINLLSELTSKQKLVKYVSKNSAPRAVFKHHLQEEMKNVDIDNMFSGSGSFIGVPENYFDVLLVDEAHRLNEKSGMFSHLGENQIKEIINAAKVPVFFLDEDQKVSLSDIGDKEEIKKLAKEIGADVYEYKLEAQFRCKGSDGYIAWLDNSLQIRETSNSTLDGVDYDFRIFDDAQEMFEEIKELNKENNKSRIVAGYCWDWKSDKNKNLNDIEIGDFKAKWNLKTDGMLWIVQPNSINEVGCIHTCQGLELDYVGVIVGQDLIVRNGQVLVDPTKRSGRDTTIKGWKRLMKEKPEETKSKLKAIIKNTYRTLMTRGQKGCFVYFVDEETREFFKKII